MKYNIGDVVTLYDKVDDEVYNTGVIKFIEQDDQIPNVFWLYVMANNENLNDKFDPRLPFRFWTIVENTSPYLFKSEMLN